jgi:hypothetical protein
MKILLGDFSAKVGREDIFKPTFGMWICMKLVNMEKTTCSCLITETTGQNHYIKVANKSFENVAEFKYLGTMSTNEKCIHEEIKRRLNMGNSCYHAVQNILPSSLLYKNSENGICKSVIISCFVWV